jgi:hypothetical protein
MLKRSSYVKDTEVIQESQNEFLVPSEEDSAQIYLSSSRVSVALALLGSMGSFVSISVLFIVFSVACESFPFVTAVDHCTFSTRRKCISTVLLQSISAHEMWPREVADTSQLVNSKRF